MTAKTENPFNIDALLTRLGHVAPDCALDQLEGVVWTRIASHSAPAHAPRWRWRAAIAVAALALGAMAGGAATSSSSELALFSTHAELAPSTLLGFSE